MIVPASRRPRFEALMCWLAAGELLALILALAGAVPFAPPFDDILSAAAPTLVLIVFAILFTRLRPSLGSLIALLFMVVNTTMVLVGDALQHVVLHPADANVDTATLGSAMDAVRDVFGNSFLYAALGMVGWLLIGEGQRWAGALALANAPIGYLDLAFASDIGFPPHTNFLLIVLWLVVLGASIWRADGVETERSAELGALHGRTA